jgi:hypothetical protein
MYFGKERHNVVNISCYRDRVSKKIKLYRSQGRQERCNVSIIMWIASLPLWSELHGFGLTQSSSPRAVLIQAGTAWWRSAPRHGQVVRCAACDRLLLLGGRTTTRRITQKKILQRVLNLTPQSRALAKLTVAQLLVRELHYFYGTLKLTAVFIKARHKTALRHIFISHLYTLFKMRFNIILPFTYRFLKWSVLFRYLRSRSAAIMQ